MMFSNVLHVKDVKTLEALAPRTFELMMTHPTILRAQRAGYGRPTPLQSGALPFALDGNGKYLLILVFLSRCSFSDLLVQAKDGTGKTLVFSMVAANMVLESSVPEVHTLAVILASSIKRVQHIKDTLLKVVPPRTHIGYVCFIVFNVI